jgi:group I intron endonuclease
MRPKPGWGIVYLITNVVNGRIYIGKTTKSLAHRWKGHRNAAVCGSRYAFHNAIRKYGPDAFTKEILAHAPPDDLNDMERIWIFLMNSIFPNGYNLREGGEGGRFDETVRRQIKTTRSKPKARREQGLRAKKLWKSPEFRTKVSEGHKRARLRPETKTNRSLASKKCWSDPEYRKRRTFSAETIEKMRTSALRRATAEYREQMSDLKKRQMTDPRIRGKFTSPEYRRKQSLTMRKIWKSRKAQGY